MDYETLVQLDETLENLAGILTERPANRGAMKAMFAKAWGRNAGGDQAAIKARSTVKGAKYYRGFRAKYAKKHKLNVGAGHGNLKGDVKMLTVPARRIKSKRGSNLKKK